MHYKKRSQSLQVTLQDDFNLHTVYKIRGLIRDREELKVDLSQSRFVDSEAVIYLQSLLQEGKKIRLKNPPRLFFEVLQILGLHTVWDLESIVEP